MKIKSQKGISLLLLILIIVLLIAIVGGATFFIINNKNNNSNNTTNTTNSKNTSTTNSTNTEMKNNVNTISESDLNSWNGTYTNGNKTIQLYRISDGFDTNYIYFQYDNQDTFDMNDYNFKVDSANKLVYEPSPFDDIDNDITITKTNDSIIVETSSADSTLAGTYKKESINNYGWDGLYTNDLASISLAQYSDDVLYVSINKITRNPNSYVGYDVILDNNDDSFHPDNSMNANELICKQDDFSIDYFKITKTDSGIKIESSSSSTSSESSNLLNEINGLEFIKAK